jgi:hypothetical protein
MMKRIAMTAVMPAVGLISDRAMSGAQLQALRRLLRPRIVGFLDDTCALGLTGLGKRLAGCPGMS